MLETPLCKSCRFYVPVEAIIAGARDTVMHCQQGCPDAGRRLRCPVYQREPGADDE